VQMKATVSINLAAIAIISTVCAMYNAHRLGKARAELAILRQAEPVVIERVVTNTVHVQCDRPHYQSVDDWRE